VLSLVPVDLVALAAVNCTDEASQGREPSDRRGSAGGHGQHLPNVLINQPISNRQGCCTSSQNSEEAKLSYGIFVPQHTMLEAFEQLHLTPLERTSLVWHLVEFQTRKTVEALLPATDAKLELGFDPQDILCGKPDTP
jgi:hypothetical protein